MANCTTAGGEEHDKRHLCWNMVGTMIVRRADFGRAIHIEFANKEFHQNLVFNDEIGASLGTMSYSGAFMASKAREINLDQYEEEEQMLNEDELESLHASYVQFRPFHSWKNIRAWKYQLPRGEDADALAVGSGWCAVATSLNYLRIFSTEGVQRFMLSFALPIVSLSAHENLLAVIHTAVPVVGHQNLGVRVIDTQNRHRTLV